MGESVFFFFFSISYDITNKSISKNDFFLGFFFGKAVVLINYQQMA